MATQLVTPKTAFPDIDLIVGDFPIVRAGVGLAAGVAGTYKKGTVVVSTAFNVDFSVPTLLTDMTTIPIIGILTEAPSHDGSAVAGSRHFVALTGSFVAKTVSAQNLAYLQNDAPTNMPALRLALYRRNLHLIGPYPANQVPG